jgi:tetraacyldisaccharide-1-P 4'-kinase
VVKELAYRDHHWFSGADLDAMARAAAGLDADAIVTTAKDAVRLDPARLHRRTRVPLAYLPIAMTIEPEPMFEEWLDGRLRAARAGRGVAA